MKHLIIEGCDRVGKDTLISNLSQHFSIITIHFQSPKAETDNQKRQIQSNFFELQYERANALHAASKISDNTLLIWNRGHLGEFVYGNLYRNTNPEEWVLQQEKEFLKFPKDTYLLLLTASPEFLSKKDDGLSFSSSIESRKTEIQEFRKACMRSHILKKREIEVEHAGNYKDSSLICQEVLNFLRS